MCDSDRLRLALLAVLLPMFAGCGPDAAPEANAASAPAGEATAQAGASGAGRPAFASGPATTGKVQPPAAEAGFGTRALNHPDDLQMVLLGYRLRGKAPPVADWAAAQSAVKRANEFERAQVREAERERLQRVYDGTAGIGRLRLNVNAQLSEYDPGRGGYYLDAFTPGSTFHFSARPAPHPFPEEHVTLQVGNLEELNFWPLDAAAAQQVLARNNGMRNVVLDSQFRITGVGQGSRGPVIELRLQGYGIASTRYGQPATLGMREFEP